jgi:hypothetical protein
LIVASSLVACGSSDSSPGGGTSSPTAGTSGGANGGAGQGGATGSGGASTTGAGGASTTSAGGHGTSAGGAAAGGAGQGGGAAGHGGAAAGGAGGKAGDPCGGCPPSYVCGTANAHPVCRAPSGVPLFSSVTVIMMENRSLSTLQKAMASNGAPNLGALAAKYATGDDYHGVTHPSLPNYIALTSGDTQGIGCDCKAEQGQGSCNALTCNLVLGSCSCDKAAANLADQLEAAKRSWMAFGEDMGAPCNVVDSGNYAVRHVPFLYYDDVQTDAKRCSAHVVDFSSYDPKAPADFDFIAPNLVNDMHNPNFGVDQNIANGDAWIGPHVDAITSAPAFAKGGLLVVAWDEDDDSGGITGTDDPVPVYVVSPYAKGGGFVSHVKADHYSLLATFEDGLGLPRLGQAGQARPGMADTLADYFPAN